MATANTQAKQFQSLHKPGHPLVLTNVYDILTAEAVASLPSSKALATASYAVAKAAGTNDDDMTLETNLDAVKGIAKVAKQYNKPLTVDLQDAYGDRLDEAITSVIKLGVSGINLEDVDKESKKQHSPEIAVERIKQALAVAKREGVPDFVINARCDTLLLGGELPEAISRGKKYLEAGATTVFVLGGPTRGVSRAEVVELVKEFEGRLNAGLGKSSANLTVKELAEIGVARISMGPTLQIKAMNFFQKEAEKLLEDSI